MDTHIRIIRKFFKYLFTMSFFLATFVAAATLAGWLAKQVTGDASDGIMLFTMLPGIALIYKIAMDKVADEDREAQRLIERMELESRRQQERNP
jgi:magnesium-transporting ATPase (P-type)